MSSDHLLESAREKIAKAVHPVSFSGAGLSAESGIATFRDRTDEGALWSRFEPQQLASQEGFMEDPSTVIDWYNWRRKTLANAKPNRAHSMLAKLQNWTHITQNVDNLLEAAGADENHVLHLHGSLLEDHCNANCGYSEKINLNASPSLRRCSCGAYMRPSVVWFGESLPEDVFNQAEEETRKADLMLVIGTSAQVYPAAGLVDLAMNNNADVIVVNTESSEDASSNVLELVGPAGTVLPQLFQSV